MIWAAQEGKLDVVQYLVKMKANVEAKTIKGIRALATATVRNSNCDTDVVFILY